jgi:transcriptional regulator with PAS, ATPase and Fis domain
VRAPLGATRIISPTPGAESISVRCARLRVARGPDKGLTLDFGTRRSAVIGTASEADVVLTDDSVSFRHAELRAEEQGYVLRDLGSTNGTRVGGVRIREVILDGKVTAISLGETDLQLATSREEVQHPLSSAGRFGTILGRSEAMREMFAVLERAADGDSTILLEGESGTGKEAIAESVHALSPRGKHPFQVVDCGSIPPTLIESELFGVQAGAFTGANRDRPGAIEEASSGTLFLDEIGELPLEMQPKLLRVLERRQVKPVGAAKFVDVDFRVIAATNRDLTKLVADGKFRSDLFYRLAVVQVKVPPLRHRRDDIPLLAQHFATVLRGNVPSLQAKGVLTQSLLAAFMAYSWPGNVRELRNAVERLIALGDLAAAPSPSPSSDAMGAGRAGAGNVTDYQAARRTAIERFERDYCKTLLDSASGVVARAAERSGISRQMFHRLLRKHGIEAD